jgi:hypothetical protein
MMGTDKTDKTSASAPRSLGDFRAVVERQPRSRSTTVSRSSVGRPSSAHSFVAPVESLEIVVGRPHFR